MTGVYLILAAYLCGSVPFGLLIGKSKGIDVRLHGSGNIGASNVGRLLGPRYFFLCFTLDVLKGLLPTLFAGWLLGPLGHFDAPASKASLWLLVMVAAVLGHVFSPWLKFKGGKGIATSLGAMLGVFPVFTFAGVTVLLVWLIVLKISRYISVSSIVAGLMIPVSIAVEFAVADLSGWRGAERQGLTETLLLAAPFLTVGVVLAILDVYTHRGNIKRLLAGTEPKAGQRVEVKADPHTDLP